MTLDTLLTEARGLPEDTLMEVVHFVRFIKSEIQAKPTEISLSRENTKTVRTAGKYRGKIKMAEDFDEPLNEFKEYGSIMRVYLDCCCYNRPYDDLSYLTVSLEAQAKLYIQNEIRRGEYELVTSEILNFEVGNCPVAIRRKTIFSYIEENSSIHVGSENSGRVKEMAREIMETGVKYKDACHVASALLARCDYFISTDKRLLKYKTERIKIINPIEFVREMEEKQHE